jgi:hypothetical protein
MAQQSGNNFMDMFMIQILGMNAMNGKTENNNNMYNAVYAIVIIGLFKQFNTLLPKIVDMLSNLITKYFEKKRNEFNMKLENRLSSKAGKQKIGSIIFDKTNSTNKDDIILNSVIYFISELKTSENIIYNQGYYVINNKEFTIKPDIYCKVHHFSKNDKGIIDKYKFEIYSYIYDVSKLRDFITEITALYIDNQSNKLGNKIYYFNEFEFKVNKEMDGSYRLDMVDKNINFTMTPFKTNKSLDNVFGSHLDILKKRVNMFIENPKWYEEKGIPYTLGVMLHGPPGTGKTSTIKAIANVTNRHIFNIHLKDTTTKSQLTNLFYNTRIKVIHDDKSEFINIPLDKRIYVFEDIDCSNDIIIDRELKQKMLEEEETTPASLDTEKTTNTFNNNFSSINQSNNQIQTNNQSELMFNSMMPSSSSFMGGSMALFEDDNLSGQPLPQQQNHTMERITPKQPDHPEKLTLSYLLNILDGILETPGRILIITSNYPDKLDKALIRPGRIDINIKVGYCNKTMVNTMFNFFYQNDNDFSNITEEQIINSNLTPAEVSKILQNNFDNHINAYNDLVNHITITN